MSFERFHVEDEDDSTPVILSASSRLLLAAFVLFVVGFVTWAAFHR